MTDNQDYKRDRRRDKVLENILNTPPDPRKSKINPKRRNPPNRRVFRGTLMIRLFDLPPLTWIERLGVHLAAKRASQVWAIIEDSSSTNSRDPQNVHGQNRPLVQEREFDL